MLDLAAGPRVSIGWLVEQLGRRSFGLTLLVLAVLGLVPGASTVIGLLMAWPAIQMVLGHEAAVLPHLVARREIEVGRLAPIIRAVTPRLAWVENDSFICFSRFYQILRIGKRREHVRETIAPVGR